jgi:hypothetical protein
MAVLAAVIHYGLPARADDPPAETPASDEQVEATHPPSVQPAATRATTEVYVTGGAAIVSAAIGAGLGISALSAESGFKSAPSESLADRGSQTAFAADVFFGIALTLAITSVTLFFTKPKPAAKPHQTALDLRF